MADSPKKFFRLGGNRIDGIDVPDDHMTIEFMFCFSYKFPARFCSFITISFPLLSRRDWMTRRTSVSQHVSQPNTFSKTFKTSLSTRFTSLSSQCPTNEVMDSLSAGRARPFGFDLVLNTLQSLSEDVQWLRVIVRWRKAFLSRWDSTITAYAIYVLVRLCPMLLRELCLMPWIFLRTRFAVTKKNLT